MFARLTNILKGMLSLFIKDIERQNPEALLELEQENLRKQIANFNQGLAAVMRTGDRSVPRGSSPICSHWRGHSSAHWGNSPRLRHLAAQRRQQGQLGIGGQSLGLAGRIAKQTLHTLVGAVKHLPIHPLVIERQAQCLTHPHVPQLG